MNQITGAITLSDLAGTISIRAEEASIVAELKAGSEEAYSWLIAHYHHPVYSLVYHIVHDPADAADTTQEVFLKVFRGMKRFNGTSSLKTWIYRIALHEASNQRRWWFRHKAKETSMEQRGNNEAGESGSGLGLKDTLVDEGTSPIESIAQLELRIRVEAELRQVPEPYRTTVILRDIEELSYEEIAEVMETSLGTVKSRITRGRHLLKARLEKLMNEAGAELVESAGLGCRLPAGRCEVEVTS